MYCMSRSLSDFDAHTPNHVASSDLKTIITVQFTHITYIAIVEPVARPRKLSSQPATLPRPRAGSRKPPRDVHANLWEIGDKYKIDINNVLQLGLDEDTCVRYFI